jgi:flagella synthesis protein FlgN
MTMPLPFTAEQLMESLSRDLSICNELLRILAEEQKALQEKDTDVLERVVTDKIPLLEALEQSAGQRQQWAQAAGAMDSEGWQALIESLNNRAISDAWQQLSERYAQTRKQNEINGKLLSRHQQTVGKILDVMRGKTAAPTLYTGSGASSTSAQSQKLGEA